jgi:hypothetical protein
LLPEKGYTSLLAACARCGDTRRAEAAAAQAAQAGLLLGPAALAARLRAAGAAGAWRAAAALHAAAPAHLARERGVLNALLDALMGTTGAAGAVAAGSRAREAPHADAQLARLRMASAAAADDAADEAALASALAAAAADAAEAAAAAAAAPLAPLLCRPGGREAVAALRWGWAYAIVPAEAKRLEGGAPLPAAPPGARVRSLQALTRTEAVVATLAALEDAAMASRPTGGSSSSSAAAAPPPVMGLLLVAGAAGGADAAAKRAWAVQRTLEREGVAWSAPPAATKLRGAAVSPQDVARWAARHWRHRAEEEARAKAAADAAAAAAAAAPKEKPDAAARVM